MLDTHLIFGYAEGMISYESITNLLASKRPRKREVLPLLLSLPGVNVCTSQPICKVLSQYDVLIRHSWSSTRDVYGIELSVCSRCGLIRVRPYSSSSKTPYYLAETQASQCPSNSVGKEALV